MSSNFSSVLAVKCGGQAVEEYAASLHFLGSLCKEFEPFNRQLLLPCDLFRFTDPMFVGQVIRFDPVLYPLEGGFDGPGGRRLLQDLRDSSVEPLNHVRGPKYQQALQRRLCCLRNDLSRAANVVQTCRCQVSLFLRIDQHSMYLRGGKGVRMHQGHARLVDMAKHRPLPPSVITATMITTATSTLAMAEPTATATAATDQASTSSCIGNTGNTTNTSNPATSSSTAASAATASTTTTTVEGILPHELVVIRPEHVPIPHITYYPPDHPSEHAKKPVEYPARLVFRAAPCLRHDGYQPDQLTELELFTYTNPLLKHILVRFDPTVYPPEPGGFFGDGATRLLNELRTACDDPLTCHSHAKTEKDKLRRLCCRRGQTFKSQHIVQECLCPLKLVLYKDEHSFYFEGGSGCAVHQGHPVLQKEAQAKPKKRAATDAATNNNSDDNSNDNNNATTTTATNNNNNNNDTNSSTTPDHAPSLLQIPATNKTAKRLWNPFMDLVDAAQGLPWQQVDAIGRQVQQLAQEALMQKQLQQYQQQLQQQQLQQQLLLHHHDGNHLNNSMFSAAATATTTTNAATATATTNTTTTTTTTNTAHHHPQHANAKKRRTPSSTTTTTTTGKRRRRQQEEEFLENHHQQQQEHQQHQQQHQGEIYHDELSDVHAEVEVEEPVYHPLEAFFRYTH